MRSCWYRYTQGGGVGTCLWWSSAICKESKLQCEPQKAGLHNVAFLGLSAIHLETVTRKKALMQINHIAKFDPGLIQ